MLTSRTLLAGVAKKLALATAALGLLVQAGYAAEAPQITIAQGRLTGSAADGLKHFMGIRYAEAPVGDLRWKPPVPVAAGTAVVDATKPGAGCAQGRSPWGTPSSAEDCLFLNVTIPGKAADTGCWQKQPVMVFFHGGGCTCCAGD